MQTSPQERTQQEVEDASERSKIIMTLVWGGLAMVTVIELVVRFKLDPMFKKDHVLVNFTAPPVAVKSNGPSSFMTEEQFWSSQAVISCMSMCVTGLGLEITLGYELLKTTRITPTMEHAWFVAQFVMSIFHLTTFVCLMDARPWAIFLTVGAVWKFGFPETIMQIVMFYQPNRPRYVRLRTLLSGIGILSHKVSSMLFVSILLWGLSPWTRALMSFCTPLILQHLVVPLKYTGMGAGYLLCQLFLEIWWEWEIFGSFRVIYLPHQIPPTITCPFGFYSPLLIRCCLGMLAAHWLYWISGFINAIGKKCCTRQRKKAAVYALHGQTPVNVPESDIDPEQEAEAVARGSIRRWQMELQDDSQIIGGPEDDENAEEEEAVARDSVNKWQAQFSEFSM